MAGIVVDRLLTRFDVDLQPFGLYRVASGTTVIAQVRRTIDVYYVLAGTMYLSVGGHAPITCRAGGAVIVPPGRALAISADAGSSRDTSRSHLGKPMRDGLLLFGLGAGEKADLTVASAVVTAKETASIAPLHDLHRSIVVTHARGSFTRQAFQAMRHEIAEGGLGSRAVIATLMKACLLLLIRQHATSSGQSEDFASVVRDSRLALAIEAVVDRPAAPHSVASLAQIAEMSRSAFAREFSEQVAISPMAFVARTRLHRAADLLSTTKLPVGEIATTIGFASRSHFSRMFRAAYGVDPSGFRDKAVASDAVALPRRAGRG